MSIQWFSRQSNLPTPRPAATLGTPLTISNLLPLMSKLPLAAQTPSGAIIKKPWRTNVYPNTHPCAPGCSLTLAANTLKVSRISQSPRFLCLFSTQGSTSLLPSPCLISAIWKHMLAKTQTESCLFWPAQIHFFLYFYFFSILSFLFLAQLTTSHLAPQLFRLGPCKGLSRMHQVNSSAFPSILLFKSFLVKAWERINPAACNKSFMFQTAADETPARRLIDST